MYKFKREDFARTLRELRGARTMKEVAKKAGIYPAEWSAYERNLRSPRSRERFEQIANGLGVDLRSLHNSIKERAARRLAAAAQEEAGANNESEELPSRPDP